MLTVNENSYVTLAEADGYVESNYRSTNNLRVLWEVLTDADREVLLKQSLQEIERLVLVGFKSDILQCLQFPRNGILEVDNNIKYAQVENALGILLADTKKVTEMQDNIADSLGLVKNIKRPNLRLRGTVGDAGGSVGTFQPVLRKILSSEKAVDLLKGWFR